MKNPNDEKSSAMAIVGGTASEIGGGKFTNGAWGSAFQYLFNDLSLKQSLIKLWNRKGEILDDAGDAFVGGAKGLHKIMTMDTTSIDSPIGRKLFEMTTLKMGAGSGSAIGYEFTTGGFSRYLMYTNPLTYDTIFTIGKGDFFHINIPKSDPNWVVRDAILAY